MKNCDPCPDTLTRLMAKKYVILLLKFTPFIILIKLVFESFIDFEFYFYKLSIILDLINNLFIIFNLFILSSLFKFCIYHRVLTYCIAAYYILNILELICNLDLILVTIILSVISIISIIVAIIHYINLKRND